MTQIDLTDEDAELFIEFQKNYDIFKILSDSGVFDVRNGSVRLHFDSHGSLVEVECQIKLFKRGFDVVPVLVALHTDVV